MWQLLFIGLILIILVSFFYPVKGIYAFYKVSLSERERIQNEDALKKLYDHEYVGEPASLNSISGAMELPLDKTVTIMNKLVSNGLVDVETGSGPEIHPKQKVSNQTASPHSGHLYYSLTENGRSYALRIIRMHRLWERYFSERTGIARDRWHHEAEIREHYTSLEEAESLARSMGNPAYDPDGDPIPTSGGEIPPLQGMPLTALQSGTTARIKHIEDEPERVYKKLIHAGLYPGMEIQIMETSNKQVTINVHGNSLTLDSLSAANITVVQAVNHPDVISKIKTLADLPLGEAAEVSAILSACRGSQRRRLLDLGLLPGTKVTAELTSYSGNPIAYNIRGASIALRKDQACLIQIKTKETVNV